MTPLRGPGAPPAPGAPLRTGRHRVQSSTWWRNHAKHHRRPFEPSARRLPTRSCRKVGVGGPYCKHATRHPVRYLAPPATVAPPASAGAAPTGPAEAIPHPVGPDETAVGYPDAPRTALRAVTNSGARTFTGMRCESLSRPERQGLLNAAAIPSRSPRRQPVQEFS